MSTTELESPLTFDSASCTLKPWMQHMAECLACLKVLIWSSQNRLTAAVLQVRQRPAWCKSQGRSKGQHAGGGHPSGAAV